MEESRELAQRVEREIAASSKISPTPHGQTDKKEKPDPALIEAINQVFALFRLNYHNQYYAAFSDEAQLRQIKKLWLESLSEFPPPQILQGAKQAIESSDYLPTLNRMRNCCSESLPALGLTAARDAYREACNAGQPAEAHPWSHDAVYWAGRDCGWTRLASSSENDGWPLFQRAYQLRVSQFLNETGLEPIPQATPDKLDLKPLEPDDARLRIQQLREDNQL